MKSKIAIPILILFIIVAFVFNMSDKNSEQIVQKKTNEIVNTTFDSIKDNQLKTDIKNEIGIRKFNSEIKKIHNHEYSKELADLLVKSNNQLKSIDSSFIKCYKKGMSVSDILSMTCEVEFQEFTDSYFIGKDSNENYPKQKVDKFYYELLNDILNKNYNECINKIDKELKQYKFTSKYNKKIANIYHDTQILMNKDSFDTTDILTNLYDPAVYTINIMQLSKQKQKELIADTNFKYIENFEKIQIKNIEENNISITDSKYKDIYKTIYDYYAPTTDDPLYTLTISKIEFTYQNNNYFAYVLINVNKSCNLYTISN